MLLAVDAPTGIPHPRKCGAGVPMVLYGSFCCHQHGWGWDGMSRQDAPIATKGFSRGQPGTLKPLSLMAGEIKPNGDAWSR